jgi:hypothetical protein
VVLAETFEKVEEMKAAKKREISSNFRLINPPMIIKIYVMLAEWGKSDNVQGLDT